MAKAVVLRNTITVLPDVVQDATRKDGARSNGQELPFAVHIDANKSDTKQTPNRT